MKINIQNRILPLFLAVLLLPSLLAVPARADSFYESNFVNILDFASVNNYGTNFFDFVGSTTVSFELGKPQVFSNVDIILYSTSPISSASISDNVGNSFELTIYQIDGNHFRLFGNLAYYGFRTLNLSLVSQYPDARTYAEVLSFRASPSDISVQDIAVSGVAHTGLSGTIKTEFNNNTVGWLVAEAPDYSCEITLVPLEWKQYDFLTIYLKHDAYEINSISADLDLMPIPYEVDYLGPSTTPNEFRYAITLDLRGLDRTRNIFPNVRVQCRLSPNEESMFQIINGVGYVILDSPDPVSFWFRSLGASLQLWFSDLRSEVASGFASIGTAIYDNVYSIVHTHLDWLNKELKKYNSSIVSTIETWGQNIVDAIAPDVDTSDMENSVADAKQDLDDAQQAMDNFTLPSVEAVVPDVSGDFELEENSNFSKMMGTFFANPLILRMVSAGVAFLLFGVIVG